jgi:hypothetical protein
MHVLRKVIVSCPQVIHAQSRLPWFPVVPTNRFWTIATGSTQEFLLEDGLIQGMAGHPRRTGGLWWGGFRA